jgi:hypothetical protein
MSRTGAVDRAAGDEVHFWDSVLAVVGGPGELQALAVTQNTRMQSGDLFSAIMPRHSRLLADTVAFVWHATPKANGYRVVVLDRADKVVYSQQVTDTTLTSTTGAMKLAAGQLYYWHVESASDAGYRTVEYALFVLSGNERTSTEATLSELRSDLDPDDAAIGQLILASAFEEMGLTYDAHRAYASAISMAPDVQNYKFMFAEFLRRQGLNMEAYAAYR